MNNHLQILAWLKLAKVSGILILLFAELSKVSAQEYEFSHFEVVAPFNIAQDVIRVDLLENKGKELIFIGNDNGQSKLTLFAFDDEKQSYQQVLIIDIPKDVFRFDVTEPKEDNSQSLYFLASNHVLYFNAKLAQPFVAVAKVDSIYINDNATYLKSAEFINDLNEDGLNDIILSDFRNLNIYLNQGANVFVKQELPIAPTVELYDNSVSYTERPYYLVDMNQDNKTDIVLSGDAELLAFMQAPGGKFATKPTSISVRKEVQSLKWWDARGADGKSLDQSNLQYRTVEELEDINGDLLPDMVVAYTQSSGVLDKSNDYEIYLGQINQGKLSYPNQASSLVKGEGTLAGFEFIDLNNDQRKEILVSSFDISVSQIISALLSGSVDQDVLIFSLDNQQKYQQRVSEQVQLKFSLSSGKSGSPVVKLADLDGDGIKELILSESETSLNIYPGDVNKQLVSTRSQSLEIRLPKNGKLLSSDDINLDGKDEIIIRYDSEDGAKRHNKLLVLQVK
ncbi:FG-GAP repeat domain-containing protein [Thalassomonas sp. M1454]|uniref:FG-GAP repeat domain-containing protein n=1 Tax=Thalassomonas sp. M1454 TaxID=2594477 RepID=UPI00118109EC|nr:VCBS repeat-containing protein [Thalassomonas sp. M1454]TRX55715.1 VCBS repeat-containing protein [Thalassomonas sp. M1454]